MSNLTQELLAKLDIIDVIGRYVNLKKAWSNFTGLCPFHNEKSPSFMVSQPKQIYKCFGCWAGWNSIKFIMEYEKVDFMDAVKELSDRYHFDYRSYLNKPEQWIQTKEIREKIKLMNKKTQQWFVEQLNTNQKASDYLIINRKLDKSVIEQFWLWYAPDSYQQLVEFLKAQWFATADMAQSWIIREHNSEYHSFLRSRITFPIHDHLGTLIWFAWRVINPEDQPKYLNSTETVLYEKSKVLYWLNQAKAHVKEFECLVVVEWYLDVIGLHRIWAPIWVATCGTALTLDHIKLLKRHTQTIKLMFDQDNAWEQAFAKWLKLCLWQWIFPQIITIPWWHKDIDEFANIWWKREDVNSSSADALWTLIDNLTHKYPINTPITRQQYSHILFEFIAEIEDVSLMQHYLGLIAHKLDTTVSVLFASYKQRFKTRTTLRRAESTPKVNKPFQPQTDIAIQSLLFQDFIHDQWRVTPKVDLWLSLIFRIRELSQSEKISQIFEEAPEELQTQFLETQLRRSKQLDSTSSDKQESVIISIVHSIIQSHRKLLLSRIAWGDESSMSLLDEIGKYLKG